MSISKLLAIVMAVLHLCSVLGLEANLLMAMVGLLRALMDLLESMNSMP